MDNDLKLIKETYIMFNLKYKEEKIMTEVIYKRGSLVDLPEQAADGEILIADIGNNKDEAEMYVGFP